MGVEYDHQAGFDLASVATVSRAQLMQALNQLTYLTNKAGIIIQATTPDVTSNSRFKRYIWLDTTAGTTPVLKLYDQSEAAGLNNAANWSATPVAAGSIVNASISAAAAIAVTKLGVAGGGARYVARINAANNAVEWIAPGSINQANEIPVVNLQVAGGDSYLKTVGGVTVWVAQATERTAIQNAITGLLPVQIAAGTNGSLLGVSGGITSFLTPDNAIGSGNLSLSRLSNNAAVSHDIIKHDGSSWVRMTPDLRITSGLAISNAGVVVGVMGVATAFTQAHGLGTVPKLIRVVARCDTADGVYNPNDELDIFSLRTVGTDFPVAGVYADATNIVVMLATAAGNKYPDKVGGGYTAMTEANWSIKVYAWK